MSRLDSAIRRLKAQRACLDAAVTALAGQGGPVLELGLGNGRTYDHLRDRLGGAARIYVFEREVRAHPDCIPPDDRLFLGDVEETLPRAAAALGRAAVLAHCDIGTGDQAGNRALARRLAALLPDLLAPGAWIVSDQDIPIPGSRALPLPEGVSPGRYFMRRIG